ncbi:hypothetical protein BaRGS_00020164 [Batillaria attramentaria]|uniref:Uncharacterized protein n=1 Tax=Batillaria attramentaria TaxID=370345 RepID=A0ABD0KNQ3_9CAEN
MFTAGQSQGGFHSTLQLLFRALAPLNGTGLSVVIEAERQGGGHCAGGMSVRLQSYLEVPREKADSVKSFLAIKEPVECSLCQPRDGLELATTTTILVLEPGSV